MVTKKYFESTISRLVFAIFALLPAAQLPAKDPMTEGALWGAAKQIEVQYPDPEQAGLFPGRENVLFLEKTQGRSRKSRVVTVSQASGQLLGRIEYSWMKLFPPGEIALVSTFTAEISDGGSVSGVTFTANNLAGWETAVAKELAEYKENSAVQGAITAAAGEFERRGFSHLTSIPALSWAGDLLAGPNLKVWDDSVRYAYSPDRTRVKLGLTGYKQDKDGKPTEDKHYYFAIELSDYDREAGKWGKAEITAGETWEGRKPMGRQVSSTASTEILW